MRLLALLLLALAPLAAGAHEGHHAPLAAGTDSGGAVVQFMGAIHAVAAPSRCPGGGHDVCCCHDATATSSFQPVAIDAPCALLATLSFNHPPAFDRSPDAPRAFALARHSPRGPPARS